MTWLLLLACVACLPWTLHIVMRGGLAASLAAVLFSGVCLGHEFWHVNAGGAPVTLDRIAWGGLIAQTLLWRYKGWCVPRSWSIVEYGLTVFGGYLAWSTLAFGGGAPKMEPKAIFLFFYAMPLGMYWAARHISLTSQDWRRGGTLLGLFGAYLAFTAYCETHDRWNLVFPTYVRLASYVEFFGRGRGPLLNPIGNGLLLIACMTASMLAAIGKLREEYRIIPFTCDAGDGSNPSAAIYRRIKGLLHSAALFTLALVCLIGCYYTYTRSVWMGACAAIGVVVWCNAPRSWRTVLVIGALLAGSGVVIAKWDSLMSFKRDKDLSEAETADSVLLRPILAAIAMNLSQDHPFFGVGLARYLAHNHAYAYEHENPLPLEKGLPYVQHNLFLSLLVETGVIGLSMYLLLLAGWLYLAYRLWSASHLPYHDRQAGLFTAAVLCAYLVNAMFHETSLIPMVNMFLFTMTGYSMGLVVKHAGARETSHSEQEMLNLGWSPPLQVGLQPMVQQSIG